MTLVLLSWLLRPEPSATFSWACMGLVFSSVIWSVLLWTATSCVLLKQYTVSLVQSKIDRLFLKSTLYNYIQMCFGRPNSKWYLKLNYENALPDQTQTPDPRDLRDPEIPLLARCIALAHLMLCPHAALSFFAAGIPLATAFLSLFFWPAHEILEL